MTPVQLPEVPVPHWCRTCGRNRADPNAVLCLDPCHRHSPKRSRTMGADIHTCSYQCERPACIRAQRDELAARAEQDAAEIVRLRGEVALAAGWHDEAPAMPNGVEVGPLDLSAPSRVFLQVDTDGDNEDRSESIPREAWGDLTWYHERIGGQEVEYVRKDLIRAADNRDAAGVSDDDFVHPEYIRGFNDGAKATPAAVPAGEAVAPFIWFATDDDGRYGIGADRETAIGDLGGLPEALSRVFPLYTAPAAPVQAAPQEGEVPQLVRYGRGSAESPYLLDQRDDGYWTPWHVAQRELARALAAHPSACDLRAVRERVAKMIYEQWTERAGYVPWVDGGNSIMQDGARSLAESALQHRGDSRGGEGR